MAESRRGYEPHEPHAWTAEDEGRRRPRNDERDDRYPYGSDRYARYEPSRGAMHGDHRDDRGARWEAAGEDRPGYGGSTGLYRTDDRMYHDRYREQVDRGRYYKDDRDERHEHGDAASDYYRAARDQRDDYVRWSAQHNGTWGEQHVAEQGERPSWESRERGGYWRQYDNRQRFAGRGPKDYQRPDDRVREEICDRMTDDPMLDASEISVQVRQGDVMLSGSVTSRDQKRRAEDLVELVSGVKDVTNQLRVMRNGMGHDESADATRVYGRDTTSSQPVHEASKETPGKSTSSTTT